MNIQMSTAQEYISVIGSFQGTLLFFLLVADGRMTTASRILGVICLIVALIFLMPFLLLNIENRIIAHIFGVLFFLPVALGPLGYLYSRTAILEAPLVKRDLFHVLPVLFFYLVTVDISLVDPQSMIERFDSTQAPNLRLQLVQFVPVGLAYAYAGWTGMMLWRYRRQANDNLANFDPSVFNWLLTLQAFGIIVWTLKTLPGFGPELLVFADLANLILVIMTFTIAIMQWRNPQIFTIPDLSGPELSTSGPSDLDLPDTQDRIAPKNTRKDLPAQTGELDPAIRAEVFETVKSQFEDGEFYLDNKLTLTRLSTLTGVSKHHLSEVLNRHAGKNFYEFVNGYRVDFVRQRFADGAEQTVLDIALAAGFSSKSTFNAIFKQFTGQTPTQYRKALQAQKT